MTASGLRREAKRGRLRIWRVAGKDFTTLNAINRMMELCRVPAKEADIESSPADTRLSLGSKPIISPQDALRARLKQSRPQAQSKR